VAPFADSGARRSGQAGDFTTQLLYASLKTGFQVNIADMGLNVLIDLVNYAAEVESQSGKREDG
jgi:hypothetical protein